MEPPQAEVRLGPAQLEQILLNLVSNARQALEGLEGTVTLRLFPSGVQGGEREGGEEGNV